ncbi:hypothetical protein HID58_090124 [Brassica napus]|uniref:Uncharacterized protein n=1 Tax=Brassica napus TaxID=3708 RepID=A0ABQ7XFN8_BRANA|nr:hypothetical protein HID58_090124 [Brassica napus]
MTLKDDIPCSLSDNHLFTNFFHFPSHGKPFFAPLALSPSRSIFSDRFYRTGRSYLVKYLRQTPMFLSLHDDMMLVTILIVNLIRSWSFYYDECANYGYDSNYLALGLLVNSLSRDCERCSTRNSLVIASTHIPQKGISTWKESFHTNGFESITMGSSARDLVALTNEALSISKIGSGSWDPFLSDRKGCCTKCTYKRNHVTKGFLFVQMVLRTWNEHEEITILLYLLSCSAGSKCKALCGILTDRKRLHDIAFSLRTKGSLIYDARWILFYLWAPRIWRPRGFLFDCIEGLMNWDFPIWPGHFGASGSFMMKSMSAENDSEFLQSGTMQYQRRDRSTLFPIQDQPFVSVFSHREFLQMKRCQRASYFPTDPPTSIYKRWFQEYARKALRIVDSAPEMA